MMLYYLLVSIVVDECEWENHADVSYLMINMNNNEFLNKSL
jgi:hypothetical protein